MDCGNERVSFLRPRDPSLTNEYLTFESIRINLAHAKDQERLPRNQVLGCMQIYLRLKKIEEQLDEVYEVDEKTIVCKAPGDEYARKYKFSRIFDGDSTQESLFNMVVKPKLFEFINGKSSSLFAYGASGSGKTFTIVGTIEQPGIIPRTLEYLFKSLPKLTDNILFKPNVNNSISFLTSPAQKSQKKIHDDLLRASQTTIGTHHVHTYKAMQQRLSLEPSATVEDQEELLLGVWVSFAEIYNECVYDLLKPQPSKREKLNIKMSDTLPYIKDLTTVNISNSLEAYQILQYGIHNLKYASTCVNSHSSRSHSIFTIKLIQGSMKTKEYIISHFNFCDLAGSERLKRTLNTGARLKESNNINTSLLVLGKCIRTILSSQKSKDNRPVPYRESKLTQLFQRALCGLEDITMIVNVNPDKAVFEETQHTLQFTAIARQIELKKVAKIVRQIENGNCGKENTENEDAEIENAEIARLENCLSELYTELEENEMEHQEQIILIHADILNDYKKKAANIAKHYENQTKYIRKQNDDKFSEDLNLLKSKYAVVLSRRSDEIIVLDSSEDEDSKQSNKNNCFKKKLKKQSNILYDSHDIIVLSSSEEEEDISNNFAEEKDTLISSEEDEDFKNSEEVLILSESTTSSSNTQNQSENANYVVELNKPDSSLMCNGQRYSGELNSELIHKSKTESDYDFSLNSTNVMDEESLLLLESQRELEVRNVQPKFNHDECSDSLIESKSVSTENLMRESSSSNVAIDEKSNLRESFSHLKINEQPKVENFLLVKNHEAEENDNVKKQEPCESDDIKKEGPDEKNHHLMHLFLDESYRTKESDDVKKQEHGESDDIKKQELGEKDNLLMHLFLDKSYRTKENDDVKKQESRESDDIKKQGPDGKNNHLMHFFLDESYRTKESDEVKTQEPGESDDIKKQELGEKDNHLMHHFLDESYRTKENDGVKKQESGESDDIKKQGPVEKDNLLMHLFLDESYRTNF